MGGQLDKRMLHWQPATCCIFQLFIIICYLANKVLLLLLLLYDVHSTTQFYRLFSQLSAVRPTTQQLVGISPRSVRWPNLDSCTSCCVSYVRL